MRLFPQKYLKAAYCFAEAGGQALLMVRKREFNPPVGRIIDHDYERLYATARRLGVRKVFAERIGEPGQSIEIRGRYLARAMNECATPELAL